MHYPPKDGDGRVWRAWLIEFLESSLGDSRHLPCVVQASLGAASVKEKWPLVTGGPASWVTYLLFPGHGRLHSFMLETLCWPVATWPHVRLMDFKPPEMTDMSLKTISHLLSYLFFFFFKNRAQCWQEFKEISTFIQCWWVCSGSSLWEKEKNQTICNRS